MQKNQLVHLHSLFRQLRLYYEPTAEFDDGPFAEYESLNVGPAHVHKSKRAHREAVFALSEALTDELAGNGKYASDDERANQMAAEG